MLDAFGHVSVRHPRDPQRYLLSRSRAPELVAPADVLEYDLNSNPVKPTNEKLYAERVIHGEIYKARPDVMAVVHHHAPAMMPFCITGIPLVPVFHLGATAGAGVPFWDQHDEFGDTNLLVVKPEEGASLARALGKQQSRADEPAWRDRGGGRRPGAGVSRDLFLPQRRIPVCGAGARSGDPAASRRDRESRRAQCHGECDNADMGILDHAA